MYALFSNDVIKLPWLDDLFIFFLCRNFNFFSGIGSACWNNRYRMSRLPILHYKSDVLITLNSKNIYHFWCWWKSPIPGDFEIPF